MGTAAFCASLLSALVLTACGADDPGAAVGSTEPAPGEPPPAQVYEGDGMVLERRDGPDADGAKLCLGGVRLSLPPQCAGIPVANWDWAAVGAEESRGGTTWGDYHGVGTYDGEVFTVLRAEAPARSFEDP